MNKQEVIEEVKTCKSEYDSNSRDVWCYEKGFEDARSLALNSINKLDEPEKPVLTKEEAEWVDKLTDFYSLPDALYYITRCGYGYLFVFEMAKKTYELPVDSGATYGEFCKLKERLVNAVIYGYELKEEKLYTVEIPNPNRSGRSVTFLARKSDGKVELYNWTGYTSIDFEDRWEQQEYAQLTEEEIKEDFAWAWEANLAKEVEK